MTTKEEVIENGTLERSSGITNPLVLLQAAIDKGINPDQLGKLLDLQERWERNRAFAAYSTAMADAQAEMPAVCRDAENQHTKSRYAKLETVTAAIKPVYTKHGLSLSFDESDTAKEGYCRITCHVSHRDGHSESRHLDLPLDGTGIKGNANMTPLQGKGSTIAYARRYLTLMVFNVAVADEDNDGQGGCISADEIGEINDLLLECEGLGKPVDFARFKKWLGVESLDQLPRAGLAKCLHELNRKRKEAAK